MLRLLAIGLVALTAMLDPATAQGPSGQYVLTQPRHKAKVNKVDSLTIKQKVTESDPDRPVIRGTVPNPSAKKRPPSHQRFWKSRSGHTIPVH